MTPAATFAHPLPASLRLRRQTHGPHVIVLASGATFDLTEPEASDFSIHDIAHALSHICRFTGHVRRFYSVAEHSVHVSRQVPPADALAGLLHDGAEAFIGDVASPLKSLLPDYRAIERRVEAEVLKRAGLPALLPLSVKAADRAMLRAEQRQAMPQGAKDGPADGAGQDDSVAAVALQFWSPQRARAEFLARFAVLHRVGP